MDPSKVDDTVYSPLCNLSSKLNTLYTQRNSRLQYLKEKKF